MPVKGRSARSEMVQTSTNGCKQIEFPYERLCTTGRNWKGQANNKSQRSKNTSSKTTRQRYSSNPNRTNNWAQKFEFSQQL